MEATPGSKARKHIADCVQAGRCLCCSKPLLKRGLCYQCYYRWRRERQRLPTKAKQVEFDALLIRRGRLLDQQAIREYRDSSVFAAAADEVS